MHESFAISHEGKEDAAEAVVASAHDFAVLFDDRPWWVCARALQNLELVLRKVEPSWF